jgi:hypothetical protein
MPVRDYLFVDQRRLDSYVDQVACPITYDKVPVWSATAALQSVGVNAVQSRVARPLSQVEKIRTLIEYLEKNTMLARGRPTIPDSAHRDPVFRLEQCYATRVLVPPKSEVDPKFGGLTIWTSEALPANGAATDYWATTPLRCSLFLMEDYPVGDGWGCSYVSAYSSLLLLLDAAAQQLDRMGLIPELRSLSESSFRKDPVKALIGIGARAGRRRQITALYKSLNLAVEGVGEIRRAEDATMVAMGYAVVIADGWGPLVSDR